MEFSSQDMNHFNQNSLYQAIGLSVESAKDGIACVHLRPNPALCWPFEGQPHGGILFTLMDTTMAWAVLTKIDKGQNCVTINLDIQYIQGAKGDIFICNATVVHQAGRIIYTRADIRDKKEQLLATGQGVYRMIRADFEPQPMDERT